MVEKKYHNLGQQQIRSKIMVFFIILFAFLIVGRLFQLQVLKHGYYLKLANSQHWAKDVIPAKRGNIYVKDETAGGLYPLAQNKTLSFLFASPEEMKVEIKGEKKDRTAEVAKKISSLVEIEEAKILDLFSKNHTYVPLKHEIEHDLAKKIEDLELPGIYLRDEQVRNYPEETLASQLLGFVNGEGEGNYGIEEYFNEELSGKDGTYGAEIDPTGKRIAFGNKVQKPAVDGTDIVLTINRDVQLKAEMLVSEAVKGFKAEKGSVIVMDPKTGAILAMANAPTYDPNKYKEVEDYSLFKNFSVTDVYEPGSIFKAITMAVGLDKGKIEPKSKYEDTGKVVLNGYTIMNSDKKAHGIVNMAYALAQSLNTGTVHVLNLVGKETLFEYIKKFGFGLQTGIEQPSEGEGTVYGPKEVNDHGYATISFGQSISATPIQMITSFATLANGGNLVKPYLVAEKINSDGQKEVTEPTVVRRVMTEEAAEKEKEMLLEVVKTGHGKTAKVKGYGVAGKTGTAQVPNKNGRGYDAKRNIGSFIGFAPAENPRFVVLAKVDSPQGVPWAETSAAPIVGKMFDFLFKYYQIPPTEIVQ